ncbi:hypothetical protein LX36DRAFT_134376 [Colletotrichum falcatum]|nr:hypothetical protein LX36DRAFT_134376 [Colletotrichum falcatum]
MKYAFALAALAALAAAQASNPIPECAQPCLNDAVTKATNCKVGDYSCTCLSENKANIQSAATSCVIAACGVETAIKEVVPASDKLCADAAAASSAPAAASSAAASAASSAAASVSIPTSAEGSASLPVVTSASTVATSVAAATTAAGTGSASTTSAVPAGAAGIAPVGGLAMLLLGALAI